MVDLMDYTHHHDTRLSRRVSAMGHPSALGLATDWDQAGCNSSCVKHARIRKQLSGARPTIRADAHSRGHGMAQVALSRAQPSSPHRPPSRSPRTRPSTFTSAIARELADRAALTCRLKPLKKTVAIRSSPRRHSAHATECRRRKSREGGQACGAHGRPAANERVCAACASWAALVSGTGVDGEAVGGAVSCTDYTCRNLRDSRHATRYARDTALSGGPLARLHSGPQWSRA